MAVGPEEAGIREMRILEAGAEKEAPATVGEFSDSGSSCPNTNTQTFALVSWFCLSMFPCPSS